MSYQLTVQEKSGYLHFQVTGENSPENVRRYLHDILLTCIDRKQTTVLIEENLKGPGLPLIDMFQIAEKGSAEAQKHIHKVAYVDTNLQHSYKDNSFAKTVASNRGLCVRLFPSVCEAETWLTTVSESNLRLNV
jgi:hypothetical protein